ncbi:MAG: CDP-glycerol glycerophosphotransferase family protein [Sandaracinaceae bacterium]
MTGRIRAFLDDRALMARDFLRAKAQRSRKVRKLVDNPGLFFDDMMEKRAGSTAVRAARSLVRDPLGFAGRAARDRLEEASWRATRQPRRYSVVSAVYNVEPYLDAFLDSLSRQTLELDRFIEVILVDDGSTDGSAEKIARWQQRHPEAIRCVRKPNGGQASARNLGLTYATGEWVTFLDPDDRVDRRYFQRVDQLIGGPNTKQLRLVGTKIVYDRMGVRSDTHALRSQFEAGDRIVPFDSRSTELQLSAASAFFRRDLIEAHARRFDEALRPNFEDAHFVGRYLLDTPGGQLGLCARAEYAYRKRADGSSTLDASWNDRRRFDLVWERGYLDLLRASAQTTDDGRATVWAQRTVLYELGWLLRALADDRFAVAFLSDADRQTLREHIHEAASFMHPSVVWAFELAHLGDREKAGIVGLIGGEASRRHRVHVESYDAAKHLVKLAYHCANRAPSEAFFVGEREVPPAFAKGVQHPLLGQPFVQERVAWVPVAESSERFRVLLDGVEAELMHEGEPCSDIDTVQQAARRRPDPSALPRLARRRLRYPTSSAQRERYRDAFVFLDRDTHADDNAEHLYRYVQRQHAEVNAFFVLRRSSVDWDRLEREGFDLLAFGSREHHAALANATHLISSHADHYVTDYPGGQLGPYFRPPYFTFLQHGVINYDLSAWLNRKKIDCFVTSTPAEHHAIVGDGRYKFTEREVVMSGLPRHDALLKTSARPERTVLVCPTWRKQLAGSAGGGSRRTVNDTFFTSDFALQWRAFLHSSAVRDLLLEHGYRMRFLPHPNLKPYLDWFALPSHVALVEYGTGESVQGEFARAALMVTDYSSVAFEMAYLERPVLYFQFDRDVMFGGGHTGGWGYFDYERDGFGPVAMNATALQDALRETLARGGEPTSEHLARMGAAFAWRDGRCCERTFDAIRALTAPRHPRDQTERLLEQASRTP